MSTPLQSRRSISGRSGGSGQKPARVGVRVSSALIGYSHSVWHYCEIDYRLSS